MTVTRIQNSYECIYPHSLPTDEDELTTYGHESLEILKRTRGKGPDAFVDSEKFISEWEGSKDFDED